MKTALFGLMPICGTRSTLLCSADADATNEPLNGEPVPGVKPPLRRCVNRRPLEPSTEGHARGVTIICEMNEVKCHIYLTNKQTHHTLLIKLN